MNRGTSVGILAIAVIALFLGAMLSPYIIHRYDSITATVTDVTNQLDYEGSDWVFQANESSAVAYPATSDLFDFLVSCGTHLTLQAAPGVEDSEILTVIDNETIQEIVTAHPNDLFETNYTITWVVQEVTCRMGATVETYRGGLQDTKQTTYWITLQENDFSVFSNADATQAIFLIVFAYDTGEKVGSIEVDGEDRGFDFPMTQVTTESLSPWVAELLQSERYRCEYDYAELKNAVGDVKFPIVVREAAPTTIAGAARSESKVDLSIEIRILLFGTWKRSAPYVKWKSADNPDPWQWLKDLARFIILVGGVVSTVIVAVKVPNPLAKILTIIIIWLILAIPLGWYAIFGVT